MGLLETYREYGFPSAAKLYDITGGKYSMADIKKELYHNVVAQLFNHKRAFAGGHIISLAPNSQWQIDLTFMDKFGAHNRGYKYILLCVDVFSRYAYAVPLKQKTAGECAAAFRTVLSEARPDCVLSDSGNEFLGEFQNVLKTNNIAHETVVLGDHHALGIIDRLTRTLKDIMYKNFVNDNTVSWVDKIDRIVDKYNATPNAGLYGHTPEDAYHDENLIALLTTMDVALLNYKKAPVAVGDTVRLRRKEGFGLRGYHPRWSEETYPVHKISGQTIVVDRGDRKTAHKAVDIQIVPKSEKVASKLAEVQKEAQAASRLNKEKIAPVNNAGLKEKIIRDKREAPERFVGEPAPNPRSLAELRAAENARVKKRGARIPKYVQKYIDGKWIRGKVFGDKVRFLDGSKADYSKAFYKFPTDKADKKVYDELVPKLEAL